jgi:hypothetical protein
MNDTVITFIPKQDPPQVMSHFRPISLCNVLVKLNTKIIANRLRPMMCKLVKLVGEAQCGFIPGRQAADNIILAQEALHPMRKKKGRKGWMAQQVDKEKAYDRVSWKFLEQVLRKVGFQQQLIDFLCYICQTIGDVEWGEIGVFYT